MVTLIVLTVAFIMVCVGWTVDFLGSICLIVVIGLSVDYTVHLVHVYNMSSKPTREEKTREALGRMGVSVLAGAVTTFGAAVFLVGAVGARLAPTADAVLLLVMQFCCC